MKKALTLVMALVMLLSSMMFTISVSASQENSSATAENIDYIDALYFAKAPTIDGYVSEAEWGTASFTVEATDCATQDDKQPYNRFLYWRHGDVSEYSSWTYEVWFRWDENYFYVAAKVNDPDQHMLLRGTTNTWDGDAIQMRIDPAGPNAATDGEEFVINDNYTLPWSSKTLPDFLFGYCQIAGGFSEAACCLRMGIGIGQIGLDIKNGGSVHQIGAGHGQHRAKTVTLFYGDQLYR